ncbi:hypothetical protein RUM_04500 [Ruminococcus champanellensis 18P13 = JCM 17042]|uniref:Uncharacterized protein n=1 Tax=Ruminococcus champanellensis (strain DSM 18848 / JCM 17042 / KCTC 15320 / 18P13) TaxID=213810 RepID=D4LAN6_RUMC1|nr:hypothetical protein RUM_04500 [Ruminococcus champanellensis 18P13 = JCM 17042]
MESGRLESDRNINGRSFRFIPPKRLRMVPFHSVTSDLIYDEFSLNWAKITVTLPMGNVTV